MTTHRHCFTTYIAAVCEVVWDSLRDPGQTSRFWGKRLVTDWRVGSPWKLVDNDGQVSAVGAMVSHQRPRRLELTWRSLGEAAPQLSGVIIELTPHGPDTKVSVFQDRPGGEDWPLVLANLKSLLETGRTLSTNMWAHEEKVEALLLELNYGKHVVQGGLRRVVERWEKFTARIAQGAPQHYDDYINELARRKIILVIETALTPVVLAGYTERIKAADKNFLRGVVPAARSASRAVGPDRKDLLWWYFHRPKNIAPGNEPCWPSPFESQSI